MIAEDWQFFQVQPYRWCTQVVLSYPKILTQPPNQAKYQRVINELLEKLDWGVGEINHQQEDLYRLHSEEYGKDDDVLVNLTQSLTHNINLRLNLDLTLNMDKSRTTNDRRFIHDKWLSN